MASKAQRDAEKRRRKLAGEDYSDAAITAAVGALDSGSNDSGGWSGGDTGGGYSDGGSSLSF